MRIALPLFLFLPVAAAAQGLRDGDTPMSAEDLTSHLAGQTLTFYDGSTARYDANGAYSYIYQPGDPPFRGTYSAEADSQICVTFDNGFDRCDTYVLAQDRLILITADGLRFPVKTVAPNGS